MIGTSLFSSAGIAELFLNETDVKITVANELLKDRVNLYNHVYPNTNMIYGNILNDSIFKDVLNHSNKKKVDFLLASPPCQGMSVAGKNRNIEQMLHDDRNYLVFRIIDYIKAKSPSFILVENVPTFFKMELPYQGKFYKIIDIFNLLFKNKYIIEADTYDSSEFGVPQRRIRAILKLYKKGLKWGNALTSNPVNVKEAIGHLPSIEAGERSNVKWHFSRKHSKNHIDWMKNTPTGKTAFENTEFFPVKSNGERIKSYMTTYRRIKWDEPAPTITIRNDAISSQLNVHPGRQLEDGTYSDARVLTPLELMILSSIPQTWEIPDNTSEILIRTCIGECIPPLLIRKIVDQINQ